MLCLCATNYFTYLNPQSSNNMENTVMIFPSHFLCCIMNMNEQRYSLKVKIKNYETEDSLEFPTALWLSNLSFRTARPLISNRSNIPY